LFPQEFHEAHRKAEALMIALHELRGDPDKRALVPDDEYQRVRQLLNQANEAFGARDYPTADGYLVEAFDVLGKYVPAGS